MSFSFSPSCVRRFFAGDEFLSINHCQARDPQFVIRNDCTLFCNEVAELPPTFTAVHDAPSRSVIQLGEWLLGPLPNRETSFVVNLRDATVPQLVIEVDGRVYVKVVQRVKVFHETYQLDSSKGVQSTNLKQLPSYFSSITTSTSTSNAEGPLLNNDTASGSKN